MQRVTWRPMTLIAFETALIVSAVVLGAYVRLGDRAWDLMEGNLLLGVVLIASVCQLCLYFGDLYNLRVVRGQRELFLRSLQALGATSLILAAVYFWFPALIIGRGVFLIVVVFVVISIAGWRVAFEWLTKRVGVRERLLLVGTDAAAIRFAQEVDERAELGAEIVGFVDSEPVRPGTLTLNPGVIGGIEDIPSIVRDRSIDHVVVSLADARGKLPMGKLLEMKLDGVTFDDLPSVYEEYSGKIAVENLRPSWLIFSPGFRKSRVLRTTKRAVDVCAGCLGLLVAVPLVLLIALAVKMTSPGPVLYHQRRVGQHGRIFEIHKFRSMRQHAEADSGAVWSRAGDDRVTPVGLFLRRARLDELPQLWNVLRGEMSLVGPRPERPEFVSGLTDQIPFYGQRHVVKPGLTGWAQVRYTYGASVEDALEKLQYDLFYIKNMSIGLDLLIILKTIKTVVLRRGVK